MYIQLPDSEEEIEINKDEILSLIIINCKNKSPAYTTNRHFAYTCFEIKKGGKQTLSEGKNKKKKVIHVDELVVKADKVIFVNDKRFRETPAA